MQGLITLDFGNSHPHAGRFQKHSGSWSLIKVVPLQELSLYLDQLQMNPANTSVVLCEVKSREEEITKLVDLGYILTRVKNYWKGGRFAGMPVYYATTLGEDRLIEAFYCYKSLKASTLIIDAGTFVTMDVVTPQGFMGGYIFPGLENYFKTFMHGENLKEVTLTPIASNELPQKTSDAMAASYLAFGALAKKLIQENQCTKVIITGGNSEYWRKILDVAPGAAVVESMPHLIHSSLHYWMTTQIELL